MTRINLEDEYFEWMYHIVCDGRYSESHSYRKLLSYLHRTPFRWEIPKDVNRAEDGTELRYRFAYENYMDETEVQEELRGPCSVLEMMLALAIRCEETIMDDPNIGDRTSQWFWKMVVNLGLGPMVDRKFDQQYVEEVISRFLDREYDADGHGGLFVVRDCGCDLRDVEIWTQAMWFLDSIT